MADADYDESSPIQPLLDYNRDAAHSSSPSISTYTQRRRQARALLSSRAKHYVILAFVTVDVAAILADIFIGLITCDLGLEKETWVEEAKEALYFVGLTFSCLFLVELAVTVWAFGLGRFFQEWFHCFDAFVIIASFIIDIVARGVLEEIGSLVIMLRLWRLVKIVEELSVGAAERMEEIEGKVVDLERENTDLKTQIEIMRDQYWENRDGGGGGSGSGSGSGS
ncbi:hypothetical protein B0T22DRAFT_470417 [Podospora appendiculata]|uniref:Voltage-gated hydrogen channel 1 n=1 Tax=Podospora appendiculata TaxID=314037 RepID=A0AAE1C7W5_9PEZI|nr:hypothetical protein B0T22DRAFT_470417 [Podospora appendiculata]